VSGVAGRVTSAVADQVASAGTGSEPAIMSTDVMSDAPHPEARDRSAGPIVELTIPAQARFLSAARLVASSLASDLDFSVDDIDELRIAIDEALTVLIDAAPAPSSVRVRFALGSGTDGAPGELRIDGEVEAATGGGAVEPQTDGLVRRILHAVTDSYAFGPGRFELVKSSSFVAP
jgi:hypothetical protein